MCLQTLKKDIFQGCFFEGRLCCFNLTVAPADDTGRKKCSLTLPINTHHNPQRCWIPNAHRINGKLCLTEVVITDTFSASAISRVGQNSNCVTLAHKSVPLSKMLFGPLQLLNVWCESANIRNSLTQDRAFEVISVGGWRVFRHVKISKSCFLPFLSKIFNES